MKNVNEKTVDTEWLSDDLKEEVKNIFESQYGHKLTNDDIIEIAENLTNVMEVVLKFRFNKKYENQNHA